MSQAVPMPAAGGSRWPVFFVALVMFTTGASGLVFEYVLATVASYILGSSIEMWSMTIATMMLAMGVAAALQQRVPDRYLTEAFVGAECLLALLGGFGPLLLQAAFGQMTDSTLAVHYGLAGCVGFLIGIEIPLIMRINATWRPDLRENLGSVLTWDYVGGFAGALVWTFVLLRLFAVTEIAFVVAIFNFVVAMAATLVFARAGLVRRPVLLLSAQALALAALAWGMWNAGALQLRLEQALYEAPIVHAETTRYQHLVVTHDKARDDVRLYINGNLQASSLDENRYHELLVHPVMAVAERPARVLILGGGDGLALKRVLDWPGVREVLLVDLDPDMVRLARDLPQLAALNGGVFSDPRVTTVAADGVSPGPLRRIRDASPLIRGDDPPAVSLMALDADTYLRRAEEASWDVVIVDLPDPSSVDLAKLYSLEFYRHVARVLRPGGGITVQSTSPYHAKEAYLTVLRTIGAAGLSTLPYRVNVPSFGDWGFVLAWNDGRPEALVRERFAAGGGAPNTTFITPEIARASLAFGRAELASEHADVSTLMRPVLLDRYVRQAWTQPE